MSGRIVSTHTHRWVTVTAWMRVIRRCRGCSLEYDLGPAR